MPGWLRGWLCDQTTGKSLKDDSSKDKFEQMLDKLETDGQSEIDIFKKIMDEFFFLYRIDNVAEKFRFDFTP